MIGSYLRHWPPAPYEAERCPPWQEGEPKWRSHVYPRGEHPRLAIYTEGQWLEGEVTQRYTHPDGRHSYQVVLYRGIDAGSGHFWYDDACMVQLRQG